MLFRVTVASSVAPQDGVFVFQGSLEDCRAFIRTMNIVDPTGAVFILDEHFNRVE